MNFKKKAAIAVAGLAAVGCSALAYDYISTFATTKYNEYKYGYTAYHAMNPYYGWDASKDGNLVHVRIEGNQMMQLGITEGGKVLGVLINWLDVPCEKGSAIDSDSSFSNGEPMTLFCDETGRAKGTMAHSFILTLDEAYTYKKNQFNRYPDISANLSGFEYNLSGIKINLFFEAAQRYAVEQEINGR